MTTTTCLRSTPSASSPAYYRRRRRVIILRIFIASIKITISTFIYATLYGKYERCNGPCRRSHARTRRYILFTRLPRYVHVYDIHKVTARFFLSKRDEKRSYQLRYKRIYFLLNSIIIGEITYYFIFRERKHVIHYAY